MKTLIKLSVILCLLSMIQPVRICAGSDGAPVKRGNALVCSDCTIKESSGIKAPVIYDETISLVPLKGLSGLLPVVPKEASFEDEAGSADTLILNDLKPVVPVQADFNDDDPVMTFTLKHLAPKAPRSAGFDDLK